LLCLQIADDDEVKVATGVAGTDGAAERRADEQLEAAAVAEQATLRTAAGERELTNQAKERSSRTRSGVEHSAAVCSVSTPRGVAAGGARAAPNCHLRSSTRSDAAE
jgi:hypothetical protein